MTKDLTYFIAKRWSFLCGYAKILVATDKEKDLSAQKILELLVGPMRDALWQDLACLHKDFPKHAIFGSSFFTRILADLKGDWAKFSDDVQRVDLLKDERSDFENVNIPPEVKKELQALRMGIDSVPLQLAEMSQKHLLSQEATTTKLQQSLDLICAKLDAIGEKSCKVERTIATVEVRLNALEGCTSCIEYRVCEVQSFVSKSAPTFKGTCPLQSENITGHLLYNGRKILSHLLIHNLNHINPASLMEIRM